MLWKILIVAKIRPWAPWPRMTKAKARNVGLKAKA